MRKALKDLLMEEFTVVGEAASVTEALNSIRPDEVDVVVVDLTMGGDEDGPEIITHLLGAFPELKIVVYSMRVRLYTVTAAYSAGALGYVTKGSDPALLIDAICSVKEGRRYYMPGIAEQIQDYQLSAKAEDPREILGELELNVFRMLAQGATPADVAESLNRKTQTIHNHATAICHKLGCNRADFNRIATKYDIIKPPLL